LKSKRIDIFDDFNSDKNEKQYTCLHIFTDLTAKNLLKSEQTNREYQSLMLSSVAHEFRNPLNSIKGNLELISLSVKDPKILK
jgi:signal transduction histidine kinase